MSDHSLPAGIQAIIDPKPRDIGAFEVRRALPAAEARSVGPFVFFDQMGPAVIPAGQGMDVRPHPHIGLSTLTWMFDGVIMHRDSLGYTQPIRPGEVNWMTAGHGIVHSERSPDESRAKDENIYGLQVWLALPKSHEEIDPSFEHYGADEIPTIGGEGWRGKLVAGTGFGVESPVAVYNPTLYADIILEAGAHFDVPTEHEQRAIYVTEGEVTVDGHPVALSTMAVLSPEAEVHITSDASARLALIGGAPLDGPRRLWWNFVATDTDKLEVAKDRWKNGGFKMVPGDDEFIPLPDR